MDDHEVVVTVEYREDPAADRKLPIAKMMTPTQPPSANLSTWRPATAANGGLVQQPLMGRQPYEASVANALSASSPTIAAPASPSLLNVSDVQFDMRYQLNITLEHCMTRFANETERFTRLQNDVFDGLPPAALDAMQPPTQQPSLFCPTTTDGLLCWPPTPLNATSSVKCFAELMSIRYDDTQSATRQCLWNGTWTRPNYSNCREIVSMADVETQTTIYLLGYILSLVTLSVALAIFTYFKELRCLRNRIHMNLMGSYMLMYCMWIVTLTVMGLKTNTPTAVCISIVTLLHYFHITTFFWMFVEGLYLYILVVRTLSRINFGLRVYVYIGWGVPFLVILIWIVVKSSLASELNDMLSSNSCTWFDSHPVDWIFQGPTVAVLLLNLIFLLAIMWVLITKLRSPHTVETKQYHKAAKALLVLMPLLGITYVITIYAPTPDIHTENIFECVRAVLLSTQGFMVALFYCFMNNEVQNTVRHHFHNWRTDRSLNSNRLGSNGASSNKDWSPRSRTESIRATEWTLVPYVEEQQPQVLLETNFMGGYGQRVPPING